jgi:hypothetical protein
VKLPVVASCRAAAAWSSRRGGGDVWSEREREKKRERERERERSRVGAEGLIRNFGKEREREREGK